MGDVGEWAAMDKGGIVFQRLHQVRHQRVLEQHGHRTVGLQVAGIDRLLVAGIGNDDVTEAAREILEENGAVGRKLDFLAQEFNREANTLCSKANAVDVTRIGLSLKSVIDQLREQVQNVE